ncbi:MAG: arsenic transporter [Bacteroidota bacterium]|nr:arsenic transporter [Bacteroidota bacterium]
MADTSIWIISFLSIAGVIIRPYKLPEAMWAVLGAFLLLIFGLILPSNALKGILNGTNVYLFLTGMMLLAETAREEKLFDWLASYATKLSRGSSQRLFILIYLVGIVVTIFLSNDATAVVLTPAVAVAAKSAKIKKPLPFLLICAFIANAASFVLPISNPANLVIYKSHLPSLWQWLGQFTLPSLTAIVTTFVLLGLTQRKYLHQKIESHNIEPKMTSGAKTALLGIAITAIILLVCSAIDIQLGLPTFFTGIATSAIVIIRSQKKPWIIIKGVSWSILPLVAGLFIIVEALNKTGLITMLSGILQQSLINSVTATTWLSGLITAYGCNLLNNLPAGLIVSNAIQPHHIPEIVKRAILIGIDLGPNLSVTGSLATILWLVALRREGISISGWAFLKLGAIIMSVALVFTLVSLWL